MLAQSASRLTAAAEAYGAVQLEQKVFVNMITMIIMDIVQTITILLYRCLQQLRWLIILHALKGSFCISIYNRLRLGWGLLLYQFAGVSIIAVRARNHTM